VPKAYFWVKKRRKSAQGKKKKQKTKKFHDDQSPNFLTNKKIYKTGQEVMAKLLY
jgi:hypothetical protein